ncbi:MAG: hypothetical protein D6714_12655 [Bacteroidetes bacterium]|nr:MAG: hypothetical protein D6714_12655 [Bacteroidota bacterium]
MRILLITPYYFPYINPRAHRWTAIAEQWAKSGHEVHVLCSRRSGFLPDADLNGVQVHRAGFNSLKEVFYHWFKPRKRRGEAAQTPVNAQTRPGRGMALLVAFNDLVFKKIYFPDDAWVWYFPARKRAVELLESYHFDALVSVSLPFTAHLVGLFCKRKRPDVFWMADVGDPFSLQPDHPINNVFLYGKKSRDLEKKVLQTADLTTVTTPGAQKLYAKHFPEAVARLRVAPPIVGKEFDEKPRAALPLNLDPDKIHLGYFGSFFKNIREPGPFLELVRAAVLARPEWKTRLEIHFFGDIIEPFFRVFDAFPDLTHLFRMYGLIAREQVPAAMSQMDCLVNIGNKTDFQLPSKSVAYLRSGKPVVNLCFVENDLFEAFFEGYPLIENIRLSDVAPSAKAVSDFVRFVENAKGQRVPAGQCDALVRPFTAEALSLSLIKWMSGKDAVEQP